MSTASSSRPPVRLMNRDFVLLWQGQLVSQLGNQAFALAMMYWTMEATGSARLMGLLMMLSLLPGVVLSPLGGALADRHSRLAIIIAADVVRGVAVLALAGLMLARPEETGLVVGALLAVALAGGVVNAAFQPAIAAAIPDLVPAERVAAANSLNQFSIQGSVFVGQAAGGVLYAALGAPFLFLIDGATYLFSAASEAFIRIPQKLPAPDAGGAGGEGGRFAAYWRDTVAGIRYLAGRRGMATFLGVAAAINFFAMPVILLLPFYVADHLAAGPEWYGFLLAALGAGAVVGYLAAGGLRIAPRARPALFVSVVVGTGASFALAGLVRSPLAALGLFFLVGAMTGLVNIIVMTLYQVSTPGEMRGRVMSLVIALAGAATPLGMALGGVLGDATGQDVPLIYGGAGGAIGLLGLAAAGLAPVREFLAWDEAAGAG